MSPKYSIGLDYGTNSVRALVVDVATGEERGTCVVGYPSGKDGILLDADPNLARQRAADYLVGLEEAVTGALKAAGKDVRAEEVVGLGVDTTGSTPIPVDADGRPLGDQDRFRDDLNAQVWLWKDHTAHAEAAEITELARRMRPQFLAKCGGAYSSEWFWAKLLHCARVAPEVFDAAASWVEHTDWLPAVLTGTARPEQTKRGICAAGHKAMFHTDWGGYPDEEFLGKLGAPLAKLRRTLPARAYNVSESAGGLSADWAKRLGLPAGIPVAVGAFDAHLGAVGAGVQPGTLVKIIGTSTCDMMVAPLSAKLPDIPGLCGIVPESILPGQYGLEAGQSAVGDIFAWFVDVVRPGGGLDHAALTAEADALRPGQSGLLALDWHNGNRTVLVDQRLSGLLLGMSLHTTPAEIYRAWVEATAFGARTIMERFEEYGVGVERIVGCGGIAAKNPMVMQIYADAMGRPVQVSRSDQTCSLGAAMCGAVVAGAHADFAAATAAMTGMQPRAYEPIEASRRTYDRLYRHYRRLHDTFGLADHAEALGDVMKDLLALRDEVRG